MDYKEQIDCLRSEISELENSELVSELFEILVDDLLFRAEAAEARAEKAERERDAAIQDMRGICYLCANAKPYSALSRTMMSCEYKQVLASIKSPGCEHFKWRGEKEE